MTIDMDGCNESAVPVNAQNIYETCGLRADDVYNSAYPSTLPTALSRQPTKDCLISTGIGIG